MDASRCQDDHPVRTGQARAGVVAPHAWRRFVVAAALAAGGCIPWGPLMAQSAIWHGAVSLDSQLVDRGLAMSPETPMLQGALSWNTASGWSAGASAATEVRAPSRVAQILAQVSHRWTLDPDWQIQGGLSYYDYPGAASLPAYDRAELGVTAQYRDTLSVGISAMRTFASGDSSIRWAGDVGFRWPLPWRFSLTASAGYSESLATRYRTYAHSQSHAYGDYGHGDGGPGYYGHDSIHAYAYGHLGLAWTHGSWRVALDRIMIDPDMRRQLGDLAASPWLGTVSWSF